MSKILIAGGAGFIGSHLCQALLEKGNEVVCVDNLITGSKKNIESFLTNEQFTFIKHDITCELRITNYELRKVQRIFHLASPASPIQYQRYPLETLLANSIGTLNLLKLAKEYKAKFLFASTSEVYGDPKEHPQKETYWGNVNPFGPRSCYDEAKRFGEALVYTFIHKYGVDARIVRIFNTYGPNMEGDDGRVISNFVNQSLRGEPITVHGDGKQTRSFCYVSDMVEGLMKAMETNGTQGEIINLGNPDEKKVIYIAELVKKLAKTNSTIKYVEPREEDIARRKPDIGKAKKLLGWQSQVRLIDGLKQTIRYFRRLHK